MHMDRPDTFRKNTQKQPTFLFTSKTFSLYIGCSQSSELNVSAPSDTQPHYSNIFLYELLGRSILKFDQSCNGNVGLPAIHMWTFSRRKRIGHATCVHIAYCYWRPFLLYILSPTYFSHNQETRDDNLTQGQHCFSGHICISDTTQWNF